MTFVCEYCNAKFKLSWNLNKHQKSAKYCLELQGKAPVKQIYMCNYCNKQFDRKDTLQRHLGTCKKRSDTLPSLNKVQQEQFDSQNTQLSTLIGQLQQTIVGLQSGCGGTTINRNNVVLSNLIPITEQDLHEHLEHLTLNFIQEGAKGYADFAGSYPFRGRLVCTDKSRKKLKYKDHDGEVIEDGGGIKLAQRFFTAIAPRNEALINQEYRSINEEVQHIAYNGTAHSADLTGLLTKATKLQELLIKCQEAARGEENELTKEFVTHLTKML